ALFVVGGEGDADAAVVDDGVRGAVSLLELVQALSDEQALDPITTNECEGGLEEVEPAEAGKLVEQHEQPVLGSSVVAELHRFGEAPADLIEHEPDERRDPDDV